MTYPQRTDDMFYCFYVNHCLMDVFNGIMSWFTQSYYTDFKYKVMGGYDKAIKLIKESYSKDKQPNIPLPSISLNPLGDIAVDPKFAQLWRVPSIGTNLQQLYMDPIYEDERFGFSVIANRFTGNFEVIIYCGSPYEYLDFFTQTLMWFHGGFNRRVRPGLISTNCIIPDEVVTTAYDGDTPYDWATAGVSKQLIKSMNSEFFVYPMTLGPQIWLTSVTNGSTIYGEDDVESYKLQLTIEYDVDLPTHVIVRRNDRIQHMNVKLSTSDPVFVPSIASAKGDDYTIVDDNPNMRDRPADALGDPKYFKILKQQEYQMYMLCPRDIIRPCKCEGECRCKSTTLTHAVTLQYRFDTEVTPDDQFVIDFSTVIPYTVDEMDKIVIGNREIGKLDYGVDYIVDTDETGTKITVLSNVKKDACWDIYIYKDLNNEEEP